uniref:Glycerate kinase n=2 Tax=Parascaris univalens TaxID=6257 RepID=A0A915AMS5_PARUN
MVFVIDTSRAVSQQDFIATSNLLSYLFEQMKISQELGQYARVGLVFGAEKAYVAANLTTYENEQQAVQNVKQLMRERRKLPVGNGLQFDVGLALIEAKNILNRDARSNRPAMVILFSATEATCHRYQSRQQGRVMRTQTEDPCRIATRLTEENNVLATVALKFGGLQRFPRLDIATPCFNITNSINLPGDLLRKICDANCFCPPPYVQYKVDQKCTRYSECLYLHGVALPFRSAADTCSDDEATLVDIFDEDKDQFIKRLHEHGAYTPYWIGLEEHNGRMFWATGRKLHIHDFTNWAPGELSGKGTCIAAGSREGNNSLWRAEKCDSLQSRYFSCQKQACDTSKYCGITPEENR